MGERSFDEVTCAGHVDQKILVGGTEAEDIEVAVLGYDMGETGVLPHGKRPILHGKDGLDLVLQPTGDYLRFMKTNHRQQGGQVLTRILEGWAI